jgi:hypothetical protein
MIEVVSIFAANTTQIQPHTELRVDGQMEKPDGSMRMRCGMRELVSCIASYHHLLRSFGKSMLAVTPECPRPIG